MPDVVNGTASAEPGSAPARARLRRLLRAADGRVAVGWRLLAYLVALLAAQLVAGGAATGLRALGAPRPVHALLFAALYVAATLGLVRVLRRRVDRRPAETLGLGGAGRRLAHALGGAAVALAMLAAVVAIEAAAGWVRVERVALWDGTVAARVIAAAFVMCAVGFCEELVFRGGFLANLAERRSIGFATVVSAV
ncbi:MAG TPA: CPBP family intramembrane glutamic endopeptidase, partial [Anaeromyxobacteraceae bacterium]|nr:CPBP family intramembrane glutamic endopeptidase [Anaeromyxobacteraceae bacterium]